MFVFSPILLHQISENKIGIKLCIKKASDATVQPKKPIRKRARKPRSLNEDSSDETSPEKRNRRTEKPRPKKTNNNTEKRSAEEAYTPPKDQSVWANGLPESVLYTVSRTAEVGTVCTAISKPFIALFRFSKTPSRRRAAYRR